MSDLFNVAKSGMVASRVALTTTSENVANANTEGYSRREVITSELSGSSANPLFSSLNGHGVMIEDVRRAFDALVIGQVRQTTSALASAETMEPALEQLENRMLPDAGGVTEMLDSYFEALEGLTAVPNDAGLRGVVLSAGSALASSVADMADDITDLAEYLQGQGSQVLVRVNGILTVILLLHQPLGVSAVPGANNSVLDRRDRLLTGLCRTGRSSGQLWRRRGSDHHAGKFAWRSDTSGQKRSCPGDDEQRPSAGGSPCHRRKSP